MSEALPYGGVVPAPTAEACTQPGCDRQPDTVVQHTHADYPWCVWHCPVCARIREEAR